MFNFKIIPILFFTILNSQSFADCKVVKKTYEVTEKAKKCTYVSTWQGGWTNTTYHAEEMNTWISPDCNGFAKPLKGKVVKTEVLSETASSCSFKTPPAQTK